MVTKHDNAWLLSEAKKIAEGLAKTLTPLCEVVVHDLTNPRHTIVFIANNLSGRKVGDPATELGLARIADPKFPDVIANYTNARFRMDGLPRALRSDCGTSRGNSSLRSVSISIFPTYAGSAVTSMPSPVRSRAKSAFRNTFPAGRA